MNRYADGSLKEIEESPYKTYGLGGADRGDFDSQNALHFLGDYLIVVNAGKHAEFSSNGSLSVFKIKEDGKLEFVDQNPETSEPDNINSRGVRPVTIDCIENNNLSWVIVGNQFGNPLGGQPIETTNLRNITAFTLDKETGILTFRNVLATYFDGKSGGPAHVQFSNNSNRLAVSTWGVPVFDAAPDTLLQKPSRVYVYDFFGNSAEAPELKPIYEKNYFQKTGIAGTIGIQWSNDNNYIYAANFNLSKHTPQYSATVLEVKANKIELVGNGFIDNIGNEACWALINKDNTKLYTASFTGNFITIFDIEDKSKLTVKDYYPRKGTSTADTKDMAFDPKGAYFYVSGGYDTHSITTYLLTGDRGLSELSSSPYKVPSARNANSEEQAFLGLLAR
ncbi:MAG: hypothetical protein ACEPOW_00050 [Bacteroidales bacterium]